MTPELLIGTWLNDSSITALIGNRKALGRLKQGTTYPALVYQIVRGKPQPKVDYSSKPQLAKFRVQFNPMAQKIEDLQAIAAALRALMDFKHQVLIGSKRVMSSRLESVGPIEPDDYDASIYTQPIDYIVWYYE